MFDSSISSNRRSQNFNYRNEKMENFWLNFLSSDWVLAIAIETVCVYMKLLHKWEWDEI